MMNDRKRVLILCTGNSARSQMAEGILRHLAGEDFEVASAGVAPSQVRPEAVKMMGELGIDISGHRSKSVDEFSGQEFDFVITVCDNANKECPVFPSKTERIHWSFEDPAAAQGDEAARLAVFRRVRDEIKAQLKNFIKRETPPTQEQLNYLWDEYKYHHGLCWKAVYKIVAVVTVLAVLPYAKPELTTPLGLLMLVPPVMGTLFAAFGFFVVKNELRLFANAKVAHHSVQKRFLSSVLTESDFAKMKKDDYDVHNPRWTLFDKYVYLLIAVLFLLSLGNAVFLALSWILGS